MKGYEKWVREEKEKYERWEREEMENIENGIKDIEQWKSEILELSVPMDDFNMRNQMSPETIANNKKLIYEYKMKLQNKTAELLESVEYMDSERLNNPDFLESINVDKINGVYIQKQYSCEGWRAVVYNEDILNMMEKSGFNDLEFKNCDIQQSESAFSDKSLESKFENCYLFSCKLANAEFVNTTFKNITFYDCVLQNVKFEDCKFEKCCNVAPCIHEKSENIKFVNTDIKDFRLNLEHADTNLDLKSVNLKKCSLENVDCYLIADGKYHNQSITKKVNSEQTLMKLLGRNLKKSLKLGETTMPKKKQRRAKVH